MNRQWSVAQYRAMDLGMFAGMLLLSETLIVNAATRWFPDQLYTVSAVAAVTAIVLMRWRGWGAVHALLGGVLYCFLSGGAGRQYLIYGLGNLLCLGVLFPLERLGSERVREDSFLTVAFALSVQLLMQLGRAVMALCLGASWGSCLGFFTTDALSLLFTGLVVWIARRLDGVFEDQNHYLLRIHKERKEEKGGY